jgi:hypothetical protein
MNKEENGNQDVGATAFDYPNSMNPKPIKQPYITNMKVPHPTNSTAKITNGMKVMCETMKGK